MAVILQHFGPLVRIDTTATKPACHRIVALPIHHLDKLFYPRSVAVVGATNQDNEAGNLVMRNLLQGGFKGPIMPVTDREQAIAGVLAYPRVDALPITPDLAVVCSPAPELPNVIRALGERGAGAAIILGAVGDGRGAGQRRQLLLNDVELG